MWQQGTCVQVSTVGSSVAEREISLLESLASFVTTDVLGPLASTCGLSSSFRPRTQKLPRVRLTFSSGTGARDQGNPWYRASDAN
ncbi:hypothetical protein I79_019074 [Cricetulus griseus]|uniref:Uncharacterized protein n=1 Tax=Cricetulus griseus TaxID=10029 RepID=G3I6F3_CRIGR|nr:hypothetical protein I79_019074 [Cricetulus griseus]